MKRVLLIFFMLSLPATALADLTTTPKEYEGIMWRWINNPEYCWICQRDWARKKYYRPEQIQSYVEAIYSSLKAFEALDDGHLKYFLAVLWQQSKLQYDAVARYNVDQKTGEYIDPKDNPWCMRRGKIRKRCRPDKRLDFSIYQFNYPTGMRFGRMVFGKRFRYQDLIDPAKAIHMGVAHVRAQERRCADWLKTAHRVRCSTKRCYKKTGCSMTCRCKVTRVCTGVATLNGGPSTICKLAKRYGQALSDIRNQDADDVTQNRYLHRTF